MSNLDFKPFYRRNLPHIQPKDGIFFVTYRLAFSLPKTALDSIKNKRYKLLNHKDLSNYKRQSYMYDYYDKILDNIDNTPVWLENKAVADLVLGNLLYHHNKRYELICAQVMPNHSHIIIRPLRNEKNENYALQTIMKWHKNYTAIHANKILNRSGQFGLLESFDHFVRDEAELYRIINYILQNPVKAWLIKDFEDWPSFWLNPNYGDITRSAGL